ncbi:RepFIB replication protein A [Salmonella enterica]|uniref:RepFIB replication protein A n=1 Tax=Salmonella enterica TaxID=28901 RepID=A0A379QIG8_SALER|nr:RepFIB replication protein A [Salmonella enterica]SUF55098.1 RepFIB replication protein A [Salmonella enterica]
MLPLCRAIANFPLPPDTERVFERMVGLSLVKTDLSTPLHVRVQDPLNDEKVRRAMEQLREIGYLDYTEIQRGRTKLFCIHYRRPKLKPPHDESAENLQLPATPGDVSPEMAEKLKLLEKLGITLDDLEKLFKSR